MRGGRHEHQGRGHRGPGRSLVHRGDVRTAVLLVLDEQPMHGYQIMQAIAERTGGLWRPSPGAVYPTIAQLEEEGLATTEDQGGRRLVTLTSEGRAYVRERAHRLGDPLADLARRPEVDLRGPLHEVEAAVRQVELGGRAEDIAGAHRILTDARRRLYLLLAGEADPPVA